MNSQDAVFALLADPRTYVGASRVKRIDTHAAVVFLAGAEAYKVKRAVRFPFLDQSTLDLRRRLCEAEVRVNRGFTPDLYRGVVPITREKGVLRLGGDGEVIEWAVHMRRFDENQTLDLVGARGALAPPLIAEVAGVILASHRAAKIGHGREALAEVVEESLSEILGRAEMFAASDAARLASSLRAAFASVRALLDERAAAGRVRRCHGDLHLRNIALVEGRPVLFDAIEFDEAIATIDVLYDLAFILMDLCERKFVAEANQLLNRYLWGCENLDVELGGLAAMPFFLSLRAVVHAKVDALRFQEAGHSPEAMTEARRYVEIAQAFLESRPPVLIAIGGLSGTGKTSLAARLAPHFGAEPGAVHLRSDIERKRLCGVGEYERLGEEGYREDVTTRVYAALRRQSELALRAGRSVIVDAVHALPAERESIGDVAARLGVRFVGLWLEAPLDRLIARIRARADDASDATADIVIRQARWALGRIAWTSLDASVSLDALTAAALAAAGAG